MENMEAEGGELVDVIIVDKAVQSLVEETQNGINKLKVPLMCRAPTALRNLSREAFKPRVVSIGPLHRKDANLQRFEGRKADFVRRSLSHLDSTTSLTTCVQKVASVMDKIRSCYADHMKDYDDNDLIIMMIKDACFILEWINMFEGSPMWLDDRITYDLMLLENQIPFFVLEKVYECIKYKFDKKPHPLAKFIHPLVIYTNLFHGGIQVDARTDHDHLLAYMCHCYRPISRHIEPGIPRSKIKSAVELDMAGVNFKPKKIEDPWPMAMEVKMVTTTCIFGFLRKPTLRMPVLKIDKSTELILRNLIAYEQLSMSGHYVTSYIRAMDVLIDTPEDVAKLVSSKVVVNHIGSNKEAADMINKICNEVVPESFYYTREWNMLATYCESYWPRKIAKLKRCYFQLKHTYFNNPWSMIALFAGINLFVLAWVQTIYAVKSSFIK